MFDLIGRINHVWMENPMLCCCTLKITGNWSKIQYLHRCILVRWDPIVSRNNGDNRLVCEMFSCQMNVHHPPFCVLLCLCCISRLVVEAHATRIKCGWLDTASSSMFHIRLLASSFCCSRLFVVVVIVFGEIARRKKMKQKISKYLFFLARLFVSFFF